MVLAASMAVLLPVLSLPVDDAYQPVRTLGVTMASLLMLGAGRPSRAGRLVSIAGSLLAAYLVTAIVAALLGGLASGWFGVTGRYQGLVSLFALASLGMAAALSGGTPGRGAVITFAVAGPAMTAFMLVQPLLGAEPIGLLGNRVIAGAWLSIVASVLAASALLAAGRWGLALGGAALMTGIGVGLAGSRGAWAGLALAAVVLVWATSTGARRNGARAWLLAAAIATVLIGALLGGSGSLDKLDPTSLATGSAASRSWIWRDTTRLVVSAPLTGVGPGRFLYEYPAFESAEHVVTEGADRRTDQAHSLPLHTAAETGLPGALVATALVVVALVGGVRAVRRRDGIAVVALVGFSAYLGQALFGVAAVEVDALGWLLGGVLVARGGVVGDGRADGRPDARADGHPDGRRRWFMLAASVTAAVLALTAAGASVEYLRANDSYTRSLMAFDAGRMAEAFAAADTAVRIAPGIDTYRVALADAASYGGGDARLALERLDQGLELEPASFDLALARARMLARLGEGADAIADAYVEALARYPRAVSVRPEVAAALDAAGRVDEAAEVRDGAAVDAGSTP